MGSSSQLQQQQPKGERRRRRATRFVRKFVQNATTITTVWNCINLLYLLANSEYPNKHIVETFVVRKCRRRRKKKERISVFLLLLLWLGNLLLPDVLFMSKVQRERSKIEIYCMSYIPKFRRNSLEKFFLTHILISTESRAWQTNMINKQVQRYN